MMFKHLAVSIGLAFCAVPGECTAQQKPAWQHDAPVSFVRFVESDEQLLTATKDGTVRLFDVSTGKEQRRFTTAPAAKSLGPALFALSPDGQLLAIATQEGRIRLLVVAAGKPDRVIDLNADKKSRVLGVVCLAFSPDGKALAIRSKDQSIHIVGIAEGKLLRSFGEPSSLRPFHGNFFAGGANCDDSLLFLNDNLSLCSVHVTQDGQQLGTVRLWQFGANRGKELVQSRFRLNNPFLDARTGFGIAALAYRADDTILVAWASSDGTARLLDFTAEKEIRRLPAVQQGVYVAFAFSPDAKMLAMRTSNARAIRLDDVASGKRLHVLGDATVTPNQRWPGDTQTLAFSPDGRKLAEGNGDLLRLWDVATGKEITPM